MQPLIHTYKPTLKLKVDHGPEGKTQTIKLLQETKETLCELGLGKDFVDLRTKALLTEKGKTLPRTPLRKVPMQAPATGAEQCPGNAKGSRLRIQGCGSFYLC